MSRSAPEPAKAAVPPTLRIDYRYRDLEPLLADSDVLMVIGFGAAAPIVDDPRCVRVELQPHGEVPYEVWRGGGPVSSGRVGHLQWSSDGQLLCGAVHVDEGEAGGIEQAAEQAYAQLLDFCTDQGFAAPLRLWNYIDAIIDGDGDRERYRQFNVGRARGMAGRVAQFSAATAIGRHDGSRVLQVYWLAGRECGEPIENPRQVSAFHYPRQYGPQSPSFARAMLPGASTMPLLISGTASVVGHASAHPGDLIGQLDETFRNIDSLLQGAHARRSQLSRQLGADSLLKVYVRHRDALPAIADALARRLPDSVQRLLLHAEVCRRELLVEIDSCHR